VINILLNQRRSFLLSLVFELTVIHMCTVVTVISRLVEQEYESDQPVRMWLTDMKFRFQNIFGQWKYPLKEILVLFDTGVMEFHIPTEKKKVLLFACQSGWRRHPLSTLGSFLWIDFWKYWCHVEVCTFEIDFVSRTDKIY
jgi:hypothetical protein